VKITIFGRYSLIVIDDLGKRFRIYDPTLGIRSHFNIAPPQMMPGLCSTCRSKWSGCS